MENGQTYTKHTAGEDPAPRRRRRARNGRRGLRWLRIVVIALVLLTIAVVGAVAGAVVALSRGLPSLDELTRHDLVVTSFIYDRTGKKMIGQLHGAENRVLVSGQRIPQVLKDATVAIEDQRFYQHHGVDFEGIARALWADIKAGKVVQGAGTITGQFVRNAYLGNERSFSRKVKEMVLAWQLEDRWAKDRILTEYLNTIYYGAGAYGVQAAALTYFHKPVNQISLPQAALLAAIANAPSYYSPIERPDITRQRRDEVLLLMQQQGYITKEQLEQAQATPLKVFERPLNTNVAKDPAAYFVDYVTRELVDKVGPKQAFEGGLKVYTSLDMGWQVQALNDIKSVLYDPNDPAAALVAIDPKTGYIRAMVGGTNFKKRKFNLAWQATRQLGSAAKPFALAAAIEQGANPNDTYYVSRPTTFQIPGVGPWTVVGEGLGRVNLTKAVALSDNSVFTQLCADLGPEAVIEMMHRTGIKSTLRPVLSAVLGTNDVNPLEVANAYATFASGGVRHEPQAITKIVAPDGTVLYQAKVKGTRVLSEGVAYTVTQCLKGVIQYGTAAARGYIGRPAAGKTGTTDKHWDAWFIGYTPQLATAVWMGYPQENVPMYNVHGSPAWGGQWSTLIWANFMRAALAHMPAADFPYPDAMPLWKKWMGKYSRMASPSPSPSPSKTKKPSPKPTTPSPTPTTPSPSPTTPSPSPSTPSPSPSTPSPSTPPAPRAPASLVFGWLQLLGLMRWS